MMIELMSVISLAAIGVMLFFLYNTFRVESIRQRIFSLRDELFDEALKGNISFNSQAYIATRSMLNGVIRYSHRISFARMIAYRCMMTDQAIKGAPDGLLQAMNASSTHDRALCGQYIIKANVTVAKYVLGSPLVLALFIPPIIGIILSKIGYDIAGRMVQICRQQFADFDRIVFAEGQASK